MMVRLQVWGAMFALLLACFVGGGFWFSHELTRAYQQGVASGRAELASALRSENDLRRAAAEAALAQTNAQIADLERERDLFQEQYNEVLAKAIRDADGRRLCLGPSLVRALDAVGRGAGSGSARP